MDGTGAGEACQIAARDAGDLQGLGRLVETVHKYGTRMFIQLHHPGRNYGLTGEQPVSASAVGLPGSGIAPRELTVPEIGQIEQAFVSGARIAQIAGADGIELHGAPASTVILALGVRPQKDVVDYFKATFPDAHGQAFVFEA